MEIKIANRNDLKEFLELSNKELREISSITFYASGCSELNPVDIKMLESVIPQCSTLQKVRFGMRSFEKLGVSHFSSLLQSLSRCTTLQEIDFKHNNLSALGINGCQALQALWQCPLLKTINFKNSKLGALDDHCFEKFCDFISGCQALDIDLEDNNLNTTRLQKIDILMSKKIPWVSLIKSIHSGNLELVSKILENEDNLKCIHYITSEGYSTLDIAREANPDIFQFLLKKLKEKNPGFNKEHMDYRQKAKTTKELGHVYGVSNDENNPFTLSHPITKKHEIIKLEGEPAHVSADILLRFITTYQQSRQCGNVEFFNKIVPMLKRLNRPYEETVKDNELIMGILKSNNESKESSEAHVSAIVFYKDNLIYCNRGFGKKSITGTTVYLNLIQDNPETKNEYLPQTLAAPLKQHRYGKNGVYSTQSEINAWVIELTEHYSFQVILPSKDQLHGNCSFANIKSSIQGILYLLERERLVTSGITEPSILHESAASYAADEYKRFTKFMRDEEIKKLIAQMKEALQKSYQPSSLPDAQSEAENDVLFYKQLLVRAIKAHHGSAPKTSPAKKKDELARVRMVYQELQEFSIINDIISDLEQLGIKNIKQLFQPIPENKVEAQGTFLTYFESTRESSSKPTIEDQSPSMENPKPPDMSPGK